MITTETFLTLALTGTPEECFMTTGRSKAVVIQRALILARDPDVALEHPELVGRLLAAVDAGKARRDGSGLV